MKSTIREMRHEDGERVIEIYAQAVEEGTSTFQNDCPSFDEWSKGHLQDCRFVTVADGKVVGYCSLGPTSAREAYRGVVEVSIYFDRDYRGKGLGKKLLQHLITESEKKGYWCLYSAIFSINTTSIALHKKLGFREIGTREKIAKDRFGEWQDTTLLERRCKLIY